MNLVKEFGEKLKNETTKGKKYEIILKKLRKYNHRANLQDVSCSKDGEIMLRFDYIINVEATKMIKEILDNGFVMKDISVGELEIICVFSDKK